jgi:hypothetical protein
MGLLVRDDMQHCLRYINAAANAAVRRLDCNFALPDLEKHYLDQLTELLQRPPFYYGQIQRC